MDILLFWLPIVAGIVLGGFAGNAWYGGDKILAVWLAFLGTVCLLAVVAIQIHQKIRAAEVAATATKQEATPSEGEISAQRAYISAENFSVVDAKAGSRTKFSYRVVNRGRTPAKNVRFFASVNVLPYPLPESLRSFDVQENAAIRITIPADTGQPGSKEMASPLTAEEETAIVAGLTSRLYFMGIIKYDDVFDRPHETRFCVSVGGPALGEMIAAAKTTTETIAFNTAGLFNFCDRFNEST